MDFLAIIEQFGVPITMCIAFGYFIWNEVPSIKTLIGAFLVITSSIIIFIREINLKKQVTIPRHD